MQPTKKGPERFSRSSVTSHTPGVKPALGNMCQDSRDPLTGGHCPRSLSGQGEVGKNWRAGMLRNQHVQARYKETGEGGQVT